MKISRYHLISALQEPLRLPGVQDSAEGADLRVDVQPQVQGEAGQVGPRRGRTPTPDLRINSEGNSTTISHASTVLMTLSTYLKYELECPLG